MNVQKLNVLFSDELNGLYFETRIDIKRYVTVLNAASDCISINLNEFRKRLNIYFFVHLRFVLEFYNDMQNIQWFTVNVVDGEMLTITKVSRLHMAPYLCVSITSITSKFNCFIYSELIVILF